MLSAFTARPIIELKPRDKSKIEAILAYGDRLLVGLNTGSLRIYRVNETTEESEVEDGVLGSDGVAPPTQKPIPVDLMREQEKFSKYKIEQLAIVKEANLLVSLSNGYVSTHDLQTYELQETLAKTKGASAFAVTSNIVKDSSTGVPSIVSRLAVAVKRRLLLWSWHDMELASDTNELMLVTGIKTLTWATGTKLIVGLSSSYVLVDVESNVVVDIVGPGSIGGAPGQDGGRFGGVGVASMSYIGIAGTAPKPLATRLGEGELLLAKDINTLFIDSNGSSLGRRQIPWSIAPEAIGYSYPYLLALQATKGTLELRNPETLNLLQTISLPHANQLHVPQPNVSLAHAGKGFLVMSERIIWRMRALDYDSQIDALVAREKLDEAISLLGMLEDALIRDKEGRLREIKMVKAQKLFDQKRFRESLELFTDVSAPPERVIRLFPPLISGREVPTVNEQAQNPELLHDILEQNNESAVDAGKASSNHKVDADPTKPSIRSSYNDKDDIVRDSEARANQGTLEGRDLKLATEELRVFLVSARTRLQRYINPDGTLKSNNSSTISALDEGSQPEVNSLLIKKSAVSLTGREFQLRDTAKLVDTTLFRAYMFASPSLAGPLFRIDNFCDPDVVNEKLIETGRYNDLVDFFFGKKLHRSALELLKKFGEKDEENEAASQMAGPQRTVAYLQNLPPEMIDLILQFAEWPLKKDPELGMEIFLADTENADTLPRPAVLDFLRGIDQKLEVKYLEHIIHDLNDTTADFHQRLVDVYIEGLKSNDFEDPKQQSFWTEKTLDFLRTSEYYQPYKALRQVSNDDPNVYEVRAIVLSKMGQHRQALDIYVFKLRDSEKAEEYCNQIHLTETTQRSSPAQSRRPSVLDPEDTPPSIYHTLLSLYLSPPPPHKPQWEPALNILAKHGARMPASSTLDLIPEVLPIKDLESYFCGRIRSANTIVNEGRITAGLRSSLVFNEEAKLRLGDGIPGGNGGRNRRVVITEDRVCGVCHKRFGGSAIKVLPNPLWLFEPLMVTERRPASGMFDFSS
ncbi:Vacuolar morphogenesis protein 6 [Pseudocyphellaria aurata]|nr:Vacuolar morphogenesis protein 6 [Pseudocyphellaria aurata]